MQFLKVLVIVKKNPLPEFGRSAPGRRESYLLNLDLLVHPPLEQRVVVGHGTIAETYRVSPPGHPERFPLILRQDARRLDVGQLDTISCKRITW